MTSTKYLQIYDTVARIPRGRVATYGQIADISGIPRQSRQVGYALSALPEGSSVPWHRVVNAKGQISLRTNPGSEKIQKNLLKREGIVFDRHNTIPLERFQWHPTKIRA